jgi:serine/threonine protein kinase/tetratricopeptide (TPR) repeat protein
MDDPKLPPGHEEKPGTPASPGTRAPFAGESSSSDIRSSAHAPFDPGDQPLDGATLAGQSFTPTPHPPRTRTTTKLQSGDIIGGRYEILQLLGEGGMGAVYKASDRELNRFVALKLIRSDLASNPAILARFKQELLTAHKVTHKNVIRIYDLAEADDVRFITMEFIEGCDLRHLLLDQRKLPRERAVEIIRQVCLALDAAHSVGIIHRDLKPQNIMCDKDGRILVMDFGLARSIETKGMTQTGALLGTVEYMSPEQSMGQQLDQRSDLFAIGLIFYELLTNETPYKAESAMGSLLLRNQKRAIPVSELDASVPKGLSDIVAKCLERDLTLRYQSAQEILADLDAVEGKGRVSASSLRLSALYQRVPWKWVAAAAIVVVVLSIAGWAIKSRSSSKAAPEAASTVPAGPEVSLAILPFRNGSGDANLDWLGGTLADMLSTDVGQSAHLRSISPDRLHQVLSDLRITPGTTIDPAMVGRIGEFSNADTVVWGQYVRFGDQIRIDATLRDLKHQRSIPIKVEAPNEKGLLPAIAQLAQSIRGNLALSSDVLQELSGGSLKPSSNSITALRNYNEGLDFARQGNHLEAEKRFQGAIKDDPQFALAYAQLAKNYSSMGYDNDAEQVAQKAVGLSENLSQAERYFTAATRAQVTKNYSEAIKAYESLAKAAPENTDVQFALAELYEDSGDFAKASEHYQKILAASPKDVMATLATGRVALRTGNVQASLEPLNRALSLSIQIGNDEEKATSLHDIGYAYEVLNQPDEALRNYQQALEIRRRIGEKRGVARSLNRMANVESMLGKPKPAAAHFEEALKIDREIGDKRGLADTLVDVGNFYDDKGDHDRSLKLYKESLQIERDIGNEVMQANCLNNIGSVYFSKGEYQDALTYFQQALQLREKSNVASDIVESVHNVAETSARMGQYDQAVSQYMRALDLRRSAGDARGGAIEAYSMGTLFSYQGRFGAAINSKQEALKTFRDLKDRTFWMAEILGGYGEALTLGGRGQESRGSLDEALNLARELKNDGLVAQTLVFQGDAFYYQGDSKTARTYYERAVQSAAHAKEPDKVIIAKTGLAIADMDVGQVAAAVSSLRTLAKQSEDQGFSFMAVECQVYMADGMMRNHDGAHARQELERALQRTEKLGLKPLSARAHYLLANNLRASGDAPEAQQHYRNAVELIDAMRKDAGSEKILQRADIKMMYNDASRWAQGAKS